MRLNGRRVTVLLSDEYLETVQQVYEYLVARSPTPSDITQSSVIRFCIDAGFDKVRKLKSDRGRAR